MDASSACVQCAYFPVSYSFSAHKFAYLFLIVTVQRSIKNQNSLALSNYGWLWLILFTGSQTQFYLWCYNVSIWTHATEAFAWVAVVRWVFPLFADHYVISLTFGTIHISDTNFQIFPSFFWKDVLVMKSPVSSTKACTNLSLLSLDSWNEFFTMSLPRCVLKSPITINILCFGTSFLAAASWLQWYSASLLPSTDE